MKRQLSQQEIDSYFDAAKGGPQSPSAAGAIPFDFRRLDRIAKSQVSAIHFLHESFLKTLCSSLTVYLRSFVSGSLISVEQMPYSDFVEALPSPTCLLYVSMEPYDGHGVIEASPALIAPVLDLVLGGSGKIETDLSREVTEVEKPLLDAFFQIITQDLRETWKSVVGLSFATSAIETTPQLSGRFVPTEAVVAIAMELRIGDHTGLLNLAIPSITLKTIGQKFEQQWTIRRSENPTIELAIKRKLARGLHLKLEAEYSRETISMKDLMGLSVGNLLILPGFKDAVEIKVNGKLKFKATLCRSENNVGAVVIQEAVHG